jgi:sugar/nucleoside kinase (ribokinase family)
MFVLLKDYGEDIKKWGIEVENVTTTENIETLLYLITTRR